MVQENAEIEELRSVEVHRTVLRAFFKIAQAWNLKASEQCALLGVSNATCNRFRKDQVNAPLAPDKLERLAYILNIYAALNVLLPVQERADAWVRERSTAALFGGESALRRMLGGLVGDLKVVADYLDAAQSGDFA
ncbi:MAG: DUF2384 domain-containing protein [Alphaproteobacteria bacterium]|nr:MAG: DUF2384 domain-containing protein [Alphaproteobacteria bacterium]